MWLVRHLTIARALVSFYFRIVPVDWYRRFPFLPLPPRKYLAWRFQTAYGRHRPPWPSLLKDVWQFGSWLTESKS